MTMLRAEILAAMRAALTASATSATALAERAGVHAKTIRRLRKGRPISDDSLERIARALGVDASADALEADLREAIREILAEERRGADSAPQKIPKDPKGPIGGWTTAADRLRVHPETLRLHRRAAGDDTAPWWADEDELYAWYARLRAEGRSRRRQGALVPAHASQCDEGT